MKKENTEDRRKESERVKGVLIFGVKSRAETVEQEELDRVASPRMPSLQPEGVTSRLAVTAG
ncbi:GRAM domain-containing protein [Psidium guajava]|nr:GRAM domain-containing protein [Psidium guajava]